MPHLRAKSVDFNGVAKRFCQARAHVAAAVNDARACVPLVIFTRRARAWDPFAGRHAEMLARP